MSKNIKITGQCYVIVRDNNFHPILNHKNDMVIYPENNMTFLDMVSYIPFVKSILTENPYLICCYDRLNVWILDNKDNWVNPDIQTYGASVSIITENILNYWHSMSLLPLFGKQGIQDFRKERIKCY